ncbi:MAG: Hsp70 family protein [Myxococcales bacterium]|nr:Hsp70 family protein [Myxococcales bacterium]
MDSWADKTDSSPFGILAMLASAFMATGIDFGTTNSALATSTQEGQFHLATFPQPKETNIFDRRQSQPSTPYMPTLLFFPHRENGMYAGYQAIAQYLEHGMEGRLIQSIKSFLPSTSFEKTTINNKTWSLEELIASFLENLVRLAQDRVGQLPKPIIFGRPAAFSASQKIDEMAEQRLRKAAEFAGLPDISFVIEPVAAALAYEATLETDETILVGDLGGGTTDFCVMRVGPNQRSQKDRRHSILSSGGLAVAGDRFDSTIVKEKLFPHLGYGSRYNTPTGPAEIPHWLFNKLLQWNHISFLKGRDTRAFFDAVKKNSHAPAAINALLQIVDEDLGYIMYRAVERAKRHVVTEETFLIHAEEYYLPVKEYLLRSEFHSMSVALVEEMEKKLLDVVNQANVRPRDIDTIFTTGGTSHLSIVQDMFKKIFGVEKIRARDNFTSVVDGLARSVDTSLDGHRCR